MSDFEPIEKKRKRGRPSIYDREREAEKKATPEFDPDTLEPIDPEPVPESPGSVSVPREHWVRKLVAQAYLLESRKTGDFAALFAIVRELKKYMPESEVFSE